MSTQGDPASNSSPHRRHRSDETNQIVMARDPAAFTIGLGDETPPELPPRNSGTGPYRRTRSSGTVSVVSAPAARQTTPSSSREEDNYFVPADTLRSTGSGRSSTASVVSLQETRNRIMHNKILSHNPRGVSPLEPSDAPAHAVKDMSDYSVPFNQLEDQQRGRGGSVMSISSTGSSSSLHQPATTSKIVSAYMAKRGHPPLPQGNPPNDGMTAPPAFPPPPPPEAGGPLPSSSFSPPPIPDGVIPPNSDYEDPWDARSNLRNLPIHRTRVNDERRFTAPASHRLPGSRTSPQPDVHHHHRRTDQHRRTTDPHRSHHHHDGHHSSRRDKSHGKPPPVEPAHHPRTLSGSTSDYVPPDPSPAWPPASGEPEYVVPPDAQDQPVRIRTYPPPVLHDGGGIMNGGNHYVNQPQLPAAPLSPPLPPRNARTHGYPPLLPDPSITPTDHRPPQWQIDPAIPLEDQLWYHGNISRDRAEEILQKRQDFSFLVRNSETCRMVYSLSIRDHTSRVANGFVHLKITHEKNGFVLGQFSCPYRTVPMCIDYYTRHELTIKGVQHRRLGYPVPR